MAGHLTWRVIRSVVFTESRDNWNIVDGARDAKRLAM